jgi:3-oxoacyl-[acyl-carrier protein] reductase
MIYNKNPVTVITGTRKGIGKYLAEYYHNLGHFVIGCSRDQASIELPNYEHYCLDVSDEKLVIKMVRDIKLKHGKIDNLINNAGIASMNHFLLTPIKTVNNIFNTNVVGTILFTREVAKIMATKKSGRIINFSTVAVPLNLEGEAIYASSKSAVVSLTKILAKELASFNITVNAIGPTPISTDLIKNVPKNKIDELLKRQAINRFGYVEDVSNVIDFFLKKESNFITGQIIYLGGL